MTDKIDFTPNYGPRENASIIKVIGVGGGGSNAVEHMYSEGIVGVDFLICNTDRGHLEKSPVPDKLLLGSGLGAGARPEIARQYALDSKDEIKEFIGKETKMLFITAGMGKGTGTGASPVIAEVARDMGILTVGVVTYPFKFEGMKANKQADSGIAEISKYVDSIIVVKNQNILKYYQDDTIDNAYGYADDVLKNAVKCIAELITVNYDQNVDFNDVKSIMQNSGKAMLGIATASGEDRVERVVDDALACPLLDNSVVQSAQNFLFFISYGPDAPLKIKELDDITERFCNVTSSDAQVIWGRGLDSKLGDQLKLSVILTNFVNTEKQSAGTQVIFDENKVNPVDGITVEQEAIAGAVVQPENFGDWKPQSDGLPDDKAELFGGNSGISRVAGTQNVFNLTPDESAGHANVYGNDAAARNMSAPQNPTYAPGTVIENKVVQMPSATQTQVDTWEVQQDQIFPNEESFKQSHEIPAIIRQNVMRQSQQQVAQVAEMEEEKHNYYESVPFSSFFRDIAD